MKVIFEQQIKGFRYLFFSKKYDGERFSIFKTFYFFIYLLTMILAFFEFSIQNNYTLDCNTQSGDVSCRIIHDIYGQLFHFFAFILVISAAFLVFLNRLKKSEKNKTNIISFIIWALIMLILLFMAYLFVPVDFYYGFYELGNALVVIWLLMIEPVLFFRSLILLLEIISEDYEFRGYSKKTKLFLLLDFLILFVMFVFIFWLVITYQNSNEYTLFQGVEIIYGNIELLFLGIIFLITAPLISIIYFYRKGRKKGSTEELQYQKGIIPWVTFYAIIFFVIRGIPGGFIWDETLRSITNLLDILFFLIILLIGINGVINLPNDDIQPNKFRFSRPLTWISGIPKFSKVLFLFFLGAEIFYNHLEAETVSVLAGIPNSLADLKAAALISFVFIGFLSVFLNFKPKIMPTGHIGPIKFLNSEFQNFSSKLFKRRS